MPENPQLAAMAHHLNSLVLHEKLTVDTVVHTERWTKNTEAKQKQRAKALAFLDPSLNNDDTDAIDSDDSDNTSHSNVTSAEIPKMVRSPLGGVCLNLQLRETQFKKAIAHNGCLILVFKKSIGRYLILQMFLGSGSFVYYLPDSWYIDKLQGTIYDRIKQTSRLNFYIKFHDIETVIVCVDCAQFKNFPVWWVHITDTIEHYAETIKDFFPNSLGDEKEQNNWIRRVYQEMERKYKEDVFFTDSSSKNYTPITIDAVIQNKIIMGNGIGQYFRSQVAQLSVMSYLCPFSSDFRWAFEEGYMKVILGIVLQVLKEQINPNCAFMKAFDPFILDIPHWKDFAFDYLLAYGKKNSSVVSKRTYLNLQHSLYPKDLVANEQIMAKPKKASITSLFTGNFAWHSKQDITPNLPIIYPTKIKNLKLRSIVMEPSLAALRYLEDKGRPVPDIKSLLANSDSDSGSGSETDTTIDTNAATTKKRQLTHLGAPKRKKCKPNRAARRRQTIIEHKYADFEIQRVFSILAEWKEDGLDYSRFRTLFEQRLKVETQNDVINSDSNSSSD